jgi:NADPH-dependent ferric siderophore reductase
MQADHQYMAAQVTHVVRLNRRMVRVTLGGAGIDQILAVPTAHTPAAWLKVNPYGQDGRAYTIVDPDNHAGTLSIDVVLHHSTERGNTVSQWATTVAHGTVLEVAGPRDGGVRIQEVAKWICLIGDESALPALRSIAYALPERTTRTVIGESVTRAEMEVYGVSVEHVLALTSDATEREQDRQRSLAGLLPEFDGPGQVWIAGEAGMMKSWKRLFRHQAELDLHSLVGKGYWKQGVVDHRDD